MHHQAGMLEPASNLVEHWTVLSLMSLAFDAFLVKLWRLSISPSSCSMTYSQKKVPAWMQAGHETLLNCLTSVSRVASSICQIMTVSSAAPERRKESSWEKSRARTWYVWPGRVHFNTQPACEWVVLTYRVLSKGYVSMWCMSILSMSIALSLSDRMSICTSFLWHLGAWFQESWCCPSRLS